MSSDQSVQDKLESSSGGIDIGQLFEAIDVDANGTIGLSEFCDGLWQVSMSRVPLELKRTEKLVNRLRADMERLLTENGKLAHAMLKLQGGVDQLHHLLGHYPSTPDTSCREEAPMHQKRRADDNSEVKFQDGSLPSSALFTAMAKPAWATEILDRLKQLQSECLAHRPFAASPMSRKDEEAHDFERPHLTTGHRMPRPTFEESKRQEGPAGHSRVQQLPHGRTPLGALGAELARAAGNDGNASVAEMQKV